ncbi:MAG: hypothetical protein ABSA13_19075, partial [Beijerinckiaceae bacterium]
RINAFCASENFDAFIVSAPPSQGILAENSSFKRSSFRGSDHRKVLDASELFRAIRRCSANVGNWRGAAAHVSPFMNHRDAKFSFRQIQKAVSFQSGQKWEFVGTAIDFVELPGVS